MIFNPLFISESSNGKSLVTSQNKLSNNKYLFSDIVKVVMNPRHAQNKNHKASDADNIPEQIKLTFGEEQKPIKLKFKFLSDGDKEKAKNNLAEILPDDIASLIINNDKITLDEKAVSYLSKEPLKGEIKEFVNELVGPELIKKHINNNEGLLLSLEDKKSAVNLELVKNPDNKMGKNKITVQTLVIPEKSKISSLFDDKSSSSKIFKLSPSESFISNKAEKINSEKVEEAKPSLSVYSFKPKSESYKSIQKQLDTKNGIIKNINISKTSNSLNSEINMKEVPLDKISFIPKEFKNNVSTNNTTETLKHSEVNNSDSKLKIIKANSSESEKDFSLSKITIVRKEETSDSNKIGKINIKAEKDLKSILKKIDFHQKTNSSKPELKIVNSFDKNVEKSNTNLANTESSTPKKFSDVQEPSDKKNTNLFSSKSVKTDNENLGKDKTPNLNGKETESTGSKRPTNVEASKKISSKIEKEPEKIKVNSNKDENSENKITKPEKLHENGTNKSETKFGIDGKLNNNSVKTKETHHANKSIKNNLIQSSDEKVLDKSYPVKDENSEKVMKNNKSEDVSNKSNLMKGMKDVENKPEIKSAMRSTEDFTKVNKEVNNENNLKSESIITNEKSDSKKDSNEKITYDKKESIVDKEIKVNSESKDASKNQKLRVENNTQPATVYTGELMQSKENKIVSLKIKNGVKAVKENVQTDDKVAENKIKNENAHSTKSEGENSGAMSNTSTQNIINMSEVNNHHESNFHNVLNKEGNLQQSVPISAAENIETSNGHRLVKAMEVIKEISRFVSKTERGSLSFDITPENLGKMKITVDTKDNALTARIEVNSDQSKQLIEKNLDKLYQELTENGVELSSLNISMSNSNQQNEDEENFTNNKNHNSKSLDQVGEVEEEKKKKSLGYNTYEYIA